MEKQDKVISQLRNQITSLQQTNQSLQKDLNLATKLAESRKSPLPNPENRTYLKYIGYGLALIILGLWLTNTKKYER